MSRSYTKQLFDLTAEIAKLKGRADALEEENKRLHETLQRITPTVQQSKSIDND